MCWRDALAFNSTYCSCIVPSTHIGQLTRTRDSSFKSNGLFWPLLAPAFMCGTPSLQNTHIYIIKDEYLENYLQWLEFLFLFCFVSFLWPRNHPLSLKIFTWSSVHLSLMSLSSHLPGSGTLPVTCVFIST